MLPAWLRTWWQAFSPAAELHIISVRQEGEIIGVAPLMLKDGAAYIIGSPDVCDYLDFVTAPRKEEAFFNAVLDNLRDKGVERLDLKPVRPDSTVFTHLTNIARARKYEVVCNQEEVTLELDLPATWEDYLEALTTKQRHEIRRKERRLSESGVVSSRLSESAGQADMDIFLRLFSESRQDKASFMTPAMEAFFRSMAATQAQQKLLKLKIMELDSLPVSAVMCFDYQNNVYLYNSGYDPRYAWLSVGLLSKASCIEESIRLGRKKFDFLSGAEVYKYRLGGQELPLYRCRMSLEANTRGLR